MNKTGGIVGIGLIALLVIGAFFFMRSSENLEISDDVAQESEESATEEETSSDVAESDEQASDESSEADNAETSSDVAEDEQAEATDEESSEFDSPEDESAEVAMDDEATEVESPEADSSEDEAASDDAGNDEQVSDESAEAVAAEEESSAPADETTDDESASGEDALAQVAGYIDPSLTDGEELYIDNCARCHGLDGNGTGHSIGSLGNIQGSFILSLVDSQSDDELYNTITNGKGVEMPPWGLVTTEEQRRALVAHIRTLALQ